MENVKYFQDHLLNWFKINQRTFPWRNPRLSNYQLIITEVLLQRTKAETVSKFYDNFMNTFPNWKTLAESQLQDIEMFLKPIGLYRQRAIRLQNLANYMVKNRENLPSSRAELENVPFMGQYIANAVELFIYGQRKPLLDVNMARVLERFFGPRIKIDIRYDEYLQNLAHEIVDHTNSKEISWAVLDFAALICKARKPVCIACPIFDKCKYPLKLY